MNKITMSKKSASKMATTTFSEQPQSKKLKKNKKSNKDCLRKIKRKANLLKELVEDGNDSTDSVIYVGTYSGQCLQRRISIVDLTKSSSTSLRDDTLQKNYSKTLKTIFFPSRNFNCSKPTRMTSLTTLPSLESKRMRVTKSSSTTDVNKKQPVDLDIPHSETTSMSCSDTGQCSGSRGTPVQGECKMMDWLMEQEEKESENSWEENVSLWNLENGVASNMDSVSMKND